jgi:phosphohistidine phosphatase SixA
MTPDSLSPRPIVYFARHAEKASDVGHDPPLTTTGILVSVAGGGWLRAQGTPIAGAWTTRTRRAQQTAALLLQGARLQLPVGRVSGLPSQLDRLGPRLDGFVGSVAGAVLLVGHHPTQALIERALGGGAWAVPDRHRGAIFRLERSAAGWSCVDVFPGGCGSG